VRLFVIAAVTLLCCSEIAAARTIPVLSIEGDTLLCLDTRGGVVVPTDSLISLTHRRGEVELLLNRSYATENDSLETVKALEELQLKFRQSFSPPDTSAIWAAARLNECCGNMIDGIRGGGGLRFLWMQAGTLASEHDLETALQNAIDFELHEYGISDSLQTKFDRWCLEGRVFLAEGSILSRPWSYYLVFRKEDRPEVYVLALGTPLAAFSKEDVLSFRRMIVD